MLPVHIETIQYNLLNADQEYVEEGKDSRIAGELLIAWTFL
jgi:hypothetical protein